MKERRSGYRYEYCALNSVVLFFLMGLGLAVTALAVADSNTVSRRVHGDTITLSQTEKIERTNQVKVDASRLWKTPYGKTYYLKVENADQAFIDNGVLPVATIQTDELLSRAQQVAMKSPAAIADKMVHESLLPTFSHFTGMTRKLLGGSIPANTITGDVGKLSVTRSVNWLASTEEDDIDYLGQELNDQDDSYSGKVKEGVRAVVGGPWFTIVQLYGHYLDQDAANDLSGFKSSGYGLSGALMRPVGDQFLVGAYAGWQTLSADIRHSDGEVTAGTWRLGPTFAWGSGIAHIEGLLTYSWNKVDSKVSGYSGEYKGRQWDTYIRGGVDLSLESVIRGLNVTPEVQLLYSSQNRDSFDWMYNERIKSAESKGWVTRMGGVLSYDRLQFQQPLELTLSLGWQYNQFTTGDMELEGGNAAVVDQYDQHGMYYAVGVDTKINEALNLSLSYDGILSSSALGHYFQAGLKFRF